MYRPTAAVLGVLCAFVVPGQGAEFAGDWHRQPDRVWVGPAYWANPMEDWRIRDGRLECISTGPNRNVHLLTHQLSEEDGTFEISVVVGLQLESTNQSRDREGANPPAGSVGFEIGIKSELGDYRSSLIRGKKGIFVGVSADGRLLYEFPAFGGGISNDTHPFPPEGIRLRVKVSPSGTGNHLLSVSTENVRTGNQLSKLPDQKVLDPHGNISLACNAIESEKRQPHLLQAKFWFHDLEISGTKVVENPEQAFGPILYAMHTLSRGVMTMTAQMPPIGPEDDQTVELQVPLDAANAILRVPGVLGSEISNPKSQIQWTTVARSTIDPLSRTAHFRVPHWPDTEHVPYRLVYTMRTTDGESTDHDFTGTVRRDPVDKSTISVAGFTGHKDTAFPNELLVSNVLKHDPDVCLFTGDQIYEENGGYGIIRNDARRQTLNYLRKMYLWGWSFRDVLRDRPSFVLPDDHDVYQGNIWGAGGNPTKNGMIDHAAGGFAEPADFVNAVFRTQAGHHPPAHDPAPMMQGIDCWYGEAVYGRISFAIIEDRYFKSGPEGKVNDWPGRPDHVKDVHYDTAKLDKPGLELLGERQLEFLEHWAEDWRGADMKCVCSQTIFCNLANYHGGEQEFVFADLDANGWPQTGRNKALAAMRKGFAFHYAGDQHLPSIVHHGIDTWGDAGWSFCVPSTAAGYPRSWRPDDEGRAVQNRPPGGLPNTGEYRDAFGNLMTVQAIGNPAAKNRTPVLELLHDKSSGYGMVHFHKPERTITMECFRLLFDAAKPQAGNQFPGWPTTIDMLDNYARQATGHLPTIEVTGMTDPVVQVIDESDGEIVYTVRIRGSSFRAPVFSDGPFTIRLGEWGDNERSLSGIRPADADSLERLRVNLQ